MLVCRVLSDVLEQPIDGGSPKRVSHFDSDLGFWFDWAKDGQSLAYARGVVTSDVVLFGLEKR